MQAKSSSAVTGANPAAILAVVAVLGLGDVFTAPASAQCLANETQKLTASDNTLSILFGTAVSISGDGAVIGAPNWADGGGGLGTGAAYVFRFDPASSQWLQEQRLTATEPVEQSDFGIYVAINPVDANLVIVGAWRDGENGYTAGSAYIFRFDPAMSLWVQEQKLLASDGTNFDRFGSAVSIWGDVAMVGAYLDDDPVPDTGSVYVFQYDRDSGIWNEVQKLIPLEIGRFGRSVSLQGDTALIGTCCDLEMGFQAGAAYVYRFDGTQWIQEQKLVASDGDDNDIFGWSVSLDGDVALIGAYGDNLGPIIDAGSAYVFRFDGKQWVQEQKLTASDGLTGDIFGWSVSLEGDLALIGAPLDDDYASASGSSYVFTFEGKQWNETAKLRYEQVQDVHTFGISVATDGEHVIVGANFTTVDEQAEAGAAYIYGGLGDCNDNGELDLCDIADGASRDDNNNGIPDECECPWDLDGTGSVGASDLLTLLASWGPCKGCAADFDGDGNVGASDLLALLANWGPCP